MAERLYQIRITPRGLNGSLSSVWVRTVKRTGRGAKRVYKFGTTAKLGWAKHFRLRDMKHLGQPLDIAFPNCEIEFGRRM